MSYCFDTTLMIRRQDFNASDTLQRPVLMVVPFKEAVKSVISLSTLAILLVETHNISKE